MLVTEHPYRDNEKLILTKSDSGVYIRQNETGVDYIEAIDVYPCEYSYSETERFVEKQQQCEAVIECDG